MMTGLRTREPLGFEKFMEKVQQAAETKGCVFFLDSKEGHEQVKNGLIASDCSGWLVPIGEAEEFNAEYMDFCECDCWDKYFAWETWYEDAGGNIVIEVSVV